MTTDDAFRQAVRQEIQALRQQRQRHGLQQSVAQRPAAQRPATQRLEAEYDEASWMGEAWSDLFGEDAAAGSDAASPSAQDAGDPVFEMAGEYGPLTQMGSRLRIQAEKGYRAGVMQLKDGMFLVTEIPESALEPEFGVVALLAPLAMSVATKVLESPETQAALIHAAGKGIQATGKGFKAVGKGVKRLVHPGRHRSEQSQSRRPQQAHAALPAPVRAALPAPVRAALPAPRAPMTQPAYVMAPQGLYYPAQPQGLPMAAYPGHQPFPAYPPGGGYPQLPPAQADAQALPWASPDDFQGLIDGSSWSADW